MFQPIPLEAFETRTGIRRNEWGAGWGAAREIISLRDMIKIVAVAVMPLDYLRRLLESVTLQGNPNEKPYRGCALRRVRMDPDNVLVGQTFVERSKYQAFLEDFQDAFADFCVTKGVAKCTALIALGERVSGSLAVAHYIPPIVEEHQNHERLCLVDGIHRNFLVKMIGTTLETIIVEGVKTPFPCDLHKWNAVQPVAAKPPLEKRFFNLRPELFRDLKAIGIDG